MEIGHAEESDAASLLLLYDALDTETEFMFFEPGERKASVESIQARIQSSISSDLYSLFVARDGEAVVGVAAGFSSEGMRNKHVANVIVGVRYSHWSQGVGRDLLRAVEKWARKNMKSKLELTVMQENTRAIGLYVSEGFEKEGAKRRSVKLKSGFRDEYYMGKLLE